VSARRIARAWRALVAAARRIARIPDYDAYVAHLRAHHPERAIPGAANFFADRQQARYRTGGGSCC
jgi:uncharacterized short protein YbdD (DUF466 family)